jgi:hypothetical protein
MLATGSNANRNLSPERIFGGHTDGGGFLDLCQSRLQPYGALFLAEFVLGEIWFAQTVVYPLFAKVGEEEYVAYHKFYSSRIPLPVILPGFASFLLPIGLVFFRSESVPLWMYLANVGCGLVGLLVTVALEIPQHAKLEEGGKQEAVIREFVLYNWPRTLLDHRLCVPHGVDAHLGLLASVSERLLPTSQNATSRHFGEYGI